MPKTTVIQRLRELKFDATKRQRWEIGAQVRERWRDLHEGELPEKELRRKTCGEGSHCFAVYPKWFLKEIDSIIERHRLQSQRQQELF